jgi:isopentenyl diphosphate isomerase/L-lactate dehydrogenase-like FMN-dependent dehydrogenase
MKAPEEWQTIADVVRTARFALTPPLWSFSGSGPETEVTIRRNRAAFDRIALMPRILQGAGDPDPSTTFLGHRLSVPVMLAPVGTIGMWHPEGALPAARVADRVGTISYVPDARPGLEEVRAACEGPIVYQLYPYMGDRDWQEYMLRRVENAGYSALCATVDSTGGGVRQRPLANRSLWTDEAAANEGGGRASEAAGRSRNLPRSASPQSRLTWDDLAWLRESTKLPFILKGVLSPLDAERAMGCGVDVIYVSNHDGRRQDQLPSTIEILQKVIDAVAGRAEVVVDSGFMRGTDVVKALALGASAVAIGKLMIWALAAGGEAGLQRTLEVLRREIIWTMASVGASSLADLSRDLLVPSFEPPPAPWPVESMDLMAL